MSTDQTPALDRAAEALNYAFDEEPRTALADLDEPTRLLLAEGARAAVVAALHDPDDPDWLARGIYDEMRKGTITPPWEEAHPTTQEGFRYEARCFVAAILGEAS